MNPKNKIENHLAPIPVQEMPQTTVALRISLFRSQIVARRFDDGTLRILELVLISKDVKSLLEIRSSLREFMRSESMQVLREIAEKTVEQKLLILEFFVCAFALIGDIESCLVLRYEALLLREFKATTYQWLQVSHTEWLNFAEQSLENGFYSIAAKACEKVLAGLQRNDNADAARDGFFDNVQVIEKIKRLKDIAMTSAASHSIQAQAAEYLRKKTSEKNRTNSSSLIETQYLASNMFRNGIKKRNMRILNGMLRPMAE